MDSVSPFGHLKVLLIVYWKEYSHALYTAFVYMYVHEHVLVVINFILKSPLRYYF